MKMQSADLAAAPVAELGVPSFDAGMEQHWSGEAMAGQIRQEAWVSAEGQTQAHTVRVVLSHPGKLNAMSRDMWRALRSVFESLQRNPDVRCIVIEGEGDAFCAGGDISEYERFRFAPDTLAAFHEGEVWAGLDAMLRCDIPSSLPSVARAWAQGWRLPAAATFALPPPTHGLEPPLPS